MAKIAFTSAGFGGLFDYVERLQRDTLESANVATAFLHETVVAKARDSEDWSEFADEIQVWSQDGVLWIGINNQERVSVAEALEYGDEVRPPSAFFRTLTEEFQQASDVWREEMQRRGYVYGSGMYST
jgi:hypothetical protein